MRLFEQTFGNRPIIDGSKSILDISNPNNDYRKVTQQQQAQNRDVYTAPRQIESRQTYDQDLARQGDSSHSS